MNYWWFLVVFLTAAAKGERSRIIGGNDALIVDVPYQLQLELEGWLICGASIIDSFFAITSASCVQSYNQRQLVLRAGSDRQSYGGQTHQVYRINVHPKYDDYFHDYDIAVLEVATPFRFDGNTKSVPLTATEAVAGSTARISGWGRKTEEGTNVPQLQAVDIPIIPRLNCTAIYSGDITQRMICAGLTGRDACQGDTGGPLVNTVTNTQVGIRSWSYGCARDGYPGIYTNIADKEIQDFISCVKNGNSCI